MSDTPSIRESLEAARASLDSPPASEQAATAAVVTAEPVTPTETPAEPATGGPARGPDGKFAPKTQDTPAPAGAEATATPLAEQPITEAIKPEEKGPDSQATRIPPSLSAAVKSQWSDLPPVVRDEFSRLEESFQKGKAEWAPKGQRLNRFDEILGPHLDKWRLNGLDEFSGMQALISAQAILERNPVEGLSHIARSYGVDLRALAGQAVAQQPGAEAHQSPTAVTGLDAVIRPLAEQVQALQRELQQSKQSVEQQEAAQAQATVTAFASDPKNLYFENVRHVVGGLLESGQAKTLQDATWRSGPQIRPLLLARKLEEGHRGRCSPQSSVCLTRCRVCHRGSRTRRIRARRACWIDPRHTQSSRRRAPRGHGA
jgi:hypothetical protein